MRDLPARCGYCQKRILNNSSRAWRRTPRGRPFCPCCGAIPADWQGQPEGESHV
jgi:hypothetical protein